MNDNEPADYNLAGVRFSLIEAKAGGVSLRYRNARLRDAGTHLARIKHTRTKAEFEALLRTIGLSVSRAYDLIAAAKHPELLDKQRARTAQRVAKHRQKPKNS